LKNKRRLSVILTGGGILLVTSLISLSLAMPQARTASRPPEPVWGIRLPDQANANTLGLNAYGMYTTTYGNDDVYWHDGVNVMAGVTRDSRCHCDIVYFFVKRTTPDNWAGLQGISIGSNFTVTPNTITCGFPPPFNAGGVPTCIQNFLNQRHPFEGYEHIQFRTYLFTYLEDIPIGMVKVSLNNGDWGQIFLWTRSECENPEFPPPYSPWHRVEARFKTSDDYETGGALYIERKDLNSWRIYVENQKFSVEEEYCLSEPVTGKGGKTYYADKYFTSFQGCTDFPVSYAFDLVKK